MAIYQVQLNDLPPEGKNFVGELRPAVFNERYPEGPNPSGVTEFDVTVTLDKDLILLDGTVRSEFELECIRCLRKFPFEVSLDPYSSEDPREGRANLDLTDFLREDILLTLPAYPVCEDLSDSAGPCPAAGRFASASEYVPISEDATAAPPKDVWSALDGITGRIDPK